MKRTKRSWRATWLLFLALIIITLSPVILASLFHKQQDNAVSYNTICSSNEKSFPFICHKNTPQDNRTKRALQQQPKTTTTSCRKTKSTNDNKNHKASSSLSIKPINSNTTKITAEETTSPHHVAKKQKNHTTATTSSHTNHRKTQSSKAHPAIKKQKNKQMTSTEDPPLIQGESIYIYIDESNESVYLYIDCQEFHLPLIPWRIFYDDAPTADVEEALFAKQIERKVRSWNSSRPTPIISINASQAESITLSGGDVFISRSIPLVHKPNDGCTNIIILDTRNKDCLESTENISMNNIILSEIDQLEDTLLNIIKQPCVGHIDMHNDNGKICSFPIYANQKAYLLPDDVVYPLSNEITVYIWNTTKTSEGKEIRLKLSERNDY